MDLRAGVIALNCRMYFCVFLIQLGKITKNFLSKGIKFPNIITPVKLIYMQTGCYQGIGTLSRFNFFLLGPIWDLFVFLATPSSPSGCRAMLSANPNKGDKWKR